MRSAQPLAVLVLTGLVAAGVACGNGDDTLSPPVPVPDAGIDATKDTKDAAKPGDATFAMDVQADTASGDATEVADAISPLVAIRVANWSRDAPPVDFCLALHGTTKFTGPLLATRAAALGDAGVVDGGMPGAFPTVSSYFLVAPGQYDGRLVPAGATDCSGRIVDDSTNLPQLVAETTGTIALVGVTHPTGDAGGTGLRMVGFTDDTITPNVAVRFINATPSLPSVDVGKYSGGKFTPLFAGIGFGTASTAQEAKDATPPASSTPTVDLNGYWWPSSALDGGTSLSARLPNLGDASSPDLVVSQPVGAASGAILTIAILPPSASAPNQGSGPQLLQCVDNAGTVGLLASCQTISQ